MLEQRNADPKARDMKQETIRHALFYSPSVLHLRGAGSASVAAAQADVPCSEMMADRADSGFGSRDSGSWPNCRQWRLRAPREHRRMPQLRI